MVNPNASEPNTRVEEEPEEILCYGDHLVFRYRILTEVGGSTPQYSQRHDEYFGGPEYEHLNSDDYETHEIPLTSITNEATGERISDNRAKQLVEELTAWYGDFFENGFLTDTDGRDKWEFKVPAPESEAFAGGGPFKVVYGN